MSLVTRSLLAHVNGRTVGIVGVRTTVGAAGQHAGVAVRAVVGGDANLVVPGVGIGTEGDGQRSEDSIDLGLATLTDQGWYFSEGKRCRRSGSAAA
ncbi:MAG: hypothetical protein IPJ48_11550 [Propionivibrio sp.]|uniref:Uncharacterized protein n=1 Tax=Candidatus Propionivibrio dominans TaxID=2954373 RepID=A0A9D7FD45_9RHOO|nr:hypothetical protein [Candidatus Propionivibrio dominans]